MAADPAGDVEDPHPRHEVELTDRDPRVAPHAAKLGFVHVYVAEETGETETWLTSPTSSVP